MAQVASCPKCEHELFVPEGTDANAWANCPECQAFFELKDARSRELPALLVVDPDAEGLGRQSSQTVADLPSIATWSSDSDELDFVGRIEELETNEPQRATPSRRTEQDPFSKPSGKEPPKAVAERIDASFRSARTLSDVPQPESASADPSKDDAIGRADRAAGGATIDLSVGDARLAELNADFELEPPADVPRDAATWDDSQHMDRLLADLDDQPADTFEQSGDEHTPSAEEDHFQPAGDWSPDVPVSMTPGAAGPRRKRSVLRTMVMTVVGGVIGLALGYYALLWIRGPEIDRLDLAKYLPEAVRPPSFRIDVKKPSSEVKQPAAERPSSMAAELAASEKAAESAPEPPGAPAEKQATFNAPAEPPKSKNPSDERYALPAAKDQTAVREPAPLEAPPAAPITGGTPPSAAVRIANAPSFTAGDLSTALEAAKQAQPRLVAGNLTDGKEVAQAKGAGYMAMADLVQKSMFVEESASPEAMKAREQVDELFRQTLSNAHTRNEIAQIVPKWIGLAKRQHGGVFFAGSVSRPESKGAVVECAVDLGEGQTLTVLLPAAAAKQIEGSSRAVGVVGWIVDKPAEQVEGYTGSATRAVFAKKLISLE